MQRFLKRSMITLVAPVLAALALWVPGATADLGLQNTTLSCNDGTQLDVALDAMSLIGLADAVTATTLYPAGDPALACGLSRSASASASASGSGPKDFAVGGGQYLSPTCGLVNFSFSAHVDDDALPVPGQPGVGGTYNNSVGATSTCGGEGHLVSKIDCVKVTGNLVQFTAVITHSKGSPFFGSPGNEITVSAFDNPLTPDTLTIQGGFFTTAPCVFSTSAAFQTPIVRGAISVHDT
jgi:hypothetical protein